ncbi:MAG: hypothetical protein ACOX3H_02750 [Saccharofermentanales bacterium]|jgi:ABC-type oligopeptide transport system ATPase subunit
MLLKVKNIYKSFHIGTHAVDVLKNISFQVERGKIGAKRWSKE